MRLVCLTYIVKRWWSDISSDRSSHPPRKACYLYDLWPYNHTASDIWLNYCRNRINHYLINHKNYTFELQRAFIRIKTCVQFDKMKSLNITRVEVTELWSCIHPLGKRCIEFSCWGVIKPFLRFLYTFLSNLGRCRTWRHNPFFFLNCGHIIFYISTVMIIQDKKICERLPGYPNISDLMNYCYYSSIAVGKVWHKVS